MVFSMALICFIALSSGCQRDGLHAVSGAVTLDGIPVTDGTISFMSAGDSGGSAGATIQNGTYSARVSPGKMIVKVYSERSLTEEEIKAYKSNPMTRSSITPAEQVKKQVIPEIYNDRSTLIVEISENRKNLDFHLEAKTN